MTRHLTEVPLFLPGRCYVKPAYQRILLKLSGELLKQGDNPLETSRIDAVAEEIRSLQAMGTELAIVVGAGNIFRGGTSDAAQAGQQFRVVADQIGMTATVVNAMSLALALSRKDVPSVVLSSVELPGFVELFSLEKASRAMAEGRVVLFAAGLGHPYFTTDTASAVRALEINANALVKATKVDGVYDKDPQKHADAMRFGSLTMQQAIDLNLAIMDQTAFSLCRSNRMPIVVCKFDGPGSLVAALSEGGRATVVTPD